MKSAIDTIHELAERQLFIAQGMSISPHQLCLANDIQRAVDLWRKLWLQAEERAQRTRAA